MNASLSLIGPDPYPSEETITAILESHIVNSEGEPVAEFEDEPIHAPKDDEAIDPTQMMRAVGVQFRTAGRVYEFDGGDLELAMRAVVVAETENGQAMGEVIRQPRMVPRVALPRKVFPVLRVASRHDYRQREKNREFEQQIYSYTMQRILEVDAAMSLVDVAVFHSGKKVVVYFTSDDRVDFRDLVKELVNRFRTRIELRQIGNRDAAKSLGGIGDCGRELCCSSWLREFVPVSIRMAKDQGLALNPNKISGQCGKLKCCLAYEDDTYRELGQGMPKMGKKVNCSSGCGTVVVKNVLKQEITVVLEDGEQRTLRRGEWELAHPPQRSVSRESEQEDDENGDEPPANDD